VKWLSGKKLLFTPICLNANANTNLLLLGVSMNTPSGVSLLFNTRFSPDYKDGPDCGIVTGKENDFVFRVRDIISLKLSF
jgi:hypothetical protein